MALYKSVVVCTNMKPFYSSEEGIRVHFEVSFEPIFTAVSTAEVTAVLARELAEPTVHLNDLTTLPETLHIEVSSTFYVFNFASWAARLSL